MDKRLKRVEDLVLFRYGSTGIQESIQRAIEILGYIPLYIVESINNFETDTGGAFGNVFLIPPNTTIKKKF